MLTIIMHPEMFGKSIFRGSAYPKVYLRLGADYVTRL